MKIIIIGAQGNLGTQLLQAFAGQEATGLDRRDLDFLDFSALAEKLTASKPELIINAAAYNAVDKCETENEEKALAIKLNIGLPAFLAEFCQSNSATLVHYSTDYVFSGSTDHDSFSEDAAINPLNFYGQSKAAGEKAILEKGKEGLKYYIIRTSKLFGPAGASPFAKPSFFDTMINLAQNGSAIKAVDGECSCFTYTPDLAAATASLLADQAPFGVYHLINEGAATWYLGAQEALRIKGLAVEVAPVNSEAFPRPAKRPRSSILKNTKRPLLRSWQSALAEYLGRN